MKWTNCSFSEIGTIYCRIEEAVYKALNGSNKKYFIKDHKINKREKKGIITIWNEEKMNLGGCDSVLYCRYSIKNKTATINYSDANGNEFELEVL